MSAVSGVSNNQATLPQSSSAQTYTVQHGDSLSKIAADHGVSLKALEAANPQINNPSVIYAGQHVNIPSGGANSGGRGNVDAPASTNGASAASAPSGATPSSHQERVNQAMDYFQKQGWSRAQAAGIVGNLDEESGVDPSKGQNGGGPGYGLGQWEAPRQAAFKAWAGHDIHGSSFGEQLAFVQHELTTSEKGAGNALKGATTATEAATIVCNKYERPGTPHLDVRIADANAAYKSAPTTTQGNGNGGTPAPGGSTPSKPSGGDKAPPAATNDKVHTVVKGDTLWDIAKANGVSLSSLEAANPQIKNPNLIYPGDKVKIPGGGASTNGTGGTSGTQGTGGTTGSGQVKGTNAASIGAQYLGRYESDLQKAGVTKPCPTSESCANFVTSMLQKSGQINWHSLGVHDTTTRLQAQGWHKVSLADAKPGDVWICDGANGESHTEIVAKNENGKITLIGSNNHPDRNNQQINYDTYSASIKGSYILAPP